MYVIAGVSGNTGSVVASTLLAQGKKVRVVVRDAKKGEPFRAKGAEVAVAELHDAAAVEKALTGATGAYLLVPPNPASPHVMADGKKLVDAVATAIEKTKIPHVVFLSSVGAQHETGTGPIRQLHYGEQRFGKIPSTRFTFLRAAYFMENLAPLVGAAKGGVLPVFADPSYPFTWVATHDIGTTAARALLEPPKQNEIIELEGPKTYSYNDAAAALSKTLGKPVHATVIPIDQMVPALQQAGIGEDMAKLYREMIEGMGKGLLSFSGGRHVRGTTPLETVVRNITA